MQKTQGDRMVTPFTDVAFPLRPFETLRREKIYTSKELEEAYSRYSWRKSEQEKTRYCHRWDAIFAFQHYIDKERPNIRLFGGDKALYEQLFKAEPKQTIRRCRFIATMRVVYKLDTAPLEGVWDNQVLTLLNKVFTMFDVNNTDQVEWRLMLFMLQVAAHPEVSLDSILEFGSSLLSSCGSFDLHTTDPCSIPELWEMAESLIRYDKVHEFEALLNEAWLSVVEVDPEASALCENARKDGHGPLSVKINRRMLHKILQHPKLLNLNRPSRRFGRRDSGVWCYLVEDEYYDSRLLTLLRTKRRFLRNDTAVDKFKLQAAVRSKRVIIQRWLRYNRRRGRLRELMFMILTRKCTGSSYPAFSKLKQWAMQTLASIDLQCWYRRCMAISRVKFIRRFRALVINLQARSRGLKQRRRYLRWMETRHWAATEIQRCHRGLRGRHKAKIALESFVDEGMKKVDRDAEEWLWRLGESAAIRLQHAFRRYQARKLQIKQENLQQRAYEIEKEMDRIEKENQRSIAVYKVELSAWYAKQKKELESQRLAENSTKIQRMKIVSYQRREIDRQRKVKKEADARLKARLEQEHVEEWQRRWQDIKVSRVEAKKAYLEQCLRNPETDAERAIRAGFEAEVKKQVKVVIKAADDTGIELEIPEAKQIARDQVLLSRLNEERKLVDEDMKKAAEKVEEDKAIKANEDKIRKEATSVMRQDHAARVMQKMYKEWRAYKAFRRTAQAVYTKHFDPSTGNFYWINGRLGTVWWTKPKALGSYDTDAPDEWVTMGAAYDLWYFYNPCRFEMSWIIPHGALLPCELCKALFATKLVPPSPLPPDQNPVEDENYDPFALPPGPHLYCDGCFDWFHFWGDPSRQDWSDLKYKMIAGNVVGCAVALARGDFDLLPLLPAIPPSGWRPVIDQPLLESGVGESQGVEVWQDGGTYTAEELQEYYDTTGSYYYDNSTGVYDGDEAGLESEDVYGGT